MRTKKYNKKVLQLKKELESEGVVFVSRLDNEITRYYSKVFKLEHVKWYVIQDGKYHGVCITRKSSVGMIQFILISEYIIKDIEHYWHVFLHEVGHAIHHYHFSSIGMTGLKIFDHIVAEHYAELFETEAFFDSEFCKRLIIPRILLNGTRALLRDFGLIKHKSGLNYKDIAQLRAKYNVRISLDDVYLEKFKDVHGHLFSDRWSLIG